MRDDGQGIADAATLLAFGRSEWDETTQTVEDAAGMGCYALAGGGATIRSRVEGGEGWEVTLDADHFTGKKSATVRRAENAPKPHGTEVSFGWARPARYQSDPVHRIVRYFPLPVTINGAAAEQTEYLGDAVATEIAAGARIGVMRTPNRVYKGADDRLCFHGRPVRASSLPRTPDRNAHSWEVRAEILDASRIPLVLPARNDVVESPGLRALEAAAQLAIWRAMRAAGATTDHRFWNEAFEAGIELAIPPAEAARWKPEAAEHEIETHYRAPGKPLRSAAGALVGPASDGPTDAMLARAAELNPELAERLISADNGLEGYPWYDALDRITRVQAIGIDANGNEQRLTDNEEDTRLPETIRAERIVLRLTVARGDGREARLDVESDVALHQPDDYWGGLDEVTVIVPTAPRLGVERLARMLLEAYFIASDDTSADSYETQKDAFIEDAEELATRTLINDIEAVRQRIRSVISDRVAWYVPSGKKLQIAVEPDGEGCRKIEIEISDAA